VQAAEVEPTVRDGLAATKLIADSGKAAAGDVDEQAFMALPPVSGIHAGRTTFGAHWSSHHFGAGAVVLAQMNRCSRLRRGSLHHGVTALQFCGMMVE